MKCRHSWINYTGRGVIAVALVLAALSRSVTLDTRVVFLLLAGAIIAWCVLDRNVCYLSLEDGFVFGRVGFLHRRTLSSPVTRLDFCYYSEFLLLNKVEIGTGSSRFIFRNMEHGAEFVREVNRGVKNGL